jgi:hypothetical protein
MGWLGESDGFFNLYESDNNCGSFFSLGDACQIIGCNKEHLIGHSEADDDGNLWISERVLHRLWSNRHIPSPHQPKIGNATRSFDELVLFHLMNIALPDSRVEIQVPFGRKHMDLSITYNKVTVGVEFLGPSHFINSYYNKTMVSPYDRVREAEQHFGYECVLWPYWIQRCETNVRMLFNLGPQGLASVWSTKAHFGDFEIPNPTTTILSITDRFNARKEGNLSYMYFSSHTTKPVHPIVQKIRAGKADIKQVIPQDNHIEESVWTNGI